MTKKGVRKLCLPILNIDSLDNIPTARAEAMSCLLYIPEKREEKGLEKKTYLVGVN